MEITGERRFCYEYPADVYADVQLSREELRRWQKKEREALDDGEREWLEAHLKALKQQPSVLSSIKKFWTMTLALAMPPQDGAIVFASYLALHLRLSKLLSPSYSALSASEAAAKDWEIDLSRVRAADVSKDTGRMDWPAFVESLFELADLWTATPPTDEGAAAAYAAFLDGCFERITMPPRQPVEKQTPGLDALLSERKAGLEPQPEPQDQEQRPSSSFNKTPSSEKSSEGGWREMSDVLACVGSGAAPLQNVALVPLSRMQSASRSTQQPQSRKTAPRKAQPPAAAQATRSAAAEHEELQELGDRDTSSPPGAWSQLEPGELDDVKPTPPKVRKSSAVKTGRGRARTTYDLSSVGSAAACLLFVHHQQSLSPHQYVRLAHVLMQAEKREIAIARTQKMERVDVVRSEGGVTSFDLRNNSATHYADITSMKDGIAQGESAALPVQIPAWVTKPEVRAAQNILVGMWWPASFCFCSHRAADCLLA